MWINRTRYEELVRAEERAEMLRIRVNQLEHERADAVYQQTGRPTRALVLENPLKAKGTGKVSDENRALSALDFEDMGDEAARVEGLVDVQGRIAI